MKKVVIDTRSAKRVRAGYPWIFRSETDGKSDATAGDIVDFVTGQEWVARGYFSSAPQLVGRVLTLNASNVIGKDYFRERITSALKHRDAVVGTGFYRLIHAESDGFPGLIIDRYGDVIVAQMNTAGMETLFADIQEVLIDVLKPAAIVLRNDSPSREQEGLPEETRVSYGDLPSGRINIVENGVNFLIDVMEGQKTGWFFDQRRNRADVAQLAVGRSVADIFCHTGGFGVTALAKGAASATFVDSSDKALADTKENISANSITAKCDYMSGRAFDIMEKMANEKKNFGVVCVDPPSFIKARKDMNVGMKAYQKLARLSAQITEKGGYIFFASCSHHANLPELTDAVTTGISKTGRSFQLIRTSGADADHPVHPQLPETGYLKALTYRFLD